MNHGQNLSAKWIITVFVLDRISKELARMYGNPATNTGTVFGLLPNNNTLFIIITLAIIAMILHYKKEFSGKHGTTLASIILGGAFGNIYDRIFYGNVIDFINLKIWPAFNIADAAITIGIIGLIFDMKQNKK